jgi:uncharacterized membrane protein (UPF0182 family)
MSVETPLVNRLQPEGGNGHPAPAAQPRLPDLPELELPSVPDAALFWTRFLKFGLVLLALFLLDGLTFVLFDYWLLQSLQFENVFWTNFKMGAALFTIATLLYSLAVAVPAYVHPVGAVARRIALLSSLIVGPLAGYFLCVHYLDFLLMFNPGQFGKVDPIFGLDYGFYVFVLHGLWDIMQTLLGAAICFVVSSVLCAYIAGRQAQEPAGMSRVAGVVGLCATPCTLVAVSLLGVVTASALWLSRYELVYRENAKKIDQTFYSTAVFNGATYVDVTGFFSTYNHYFVSTGIALLMTAFLVVLLRSLALAVQRDPRGDNWFPRVKKCGVWLCVLLAADFVFLGAIGLRQLIFVTPNQPVIQLEYIRRHIDATREGFNLENIEQVSFVPKDGKDPLPTAEELLAHPSMKNASLWPGFVSRLEAQLDPQHSRRVIQTNGDIVVYAPTGDIYRNQQKLRPYYNFLDVDTLRYMIDGEKTMLVSGVREVPLVEPQPWLAWWGQQFMLFTHGHGLVMSPTAGVTKEGEPIYYSSEIPTQVKHPVLAAKNQATYYAEGSGTMAYSNVRNMQELDYPTEEGRATVSMKAADATSVPIDSLLKRLVFGWRSSQFFEIVFSELIGPETHVHYYRTPLERIDRIAPFLFLDTDPFAFTADGEILWMVNAMSVSDRFPYSKYDMLGDQADERSGPYFGRRHWRINYVRDAVKATVNAYSGKVTLYQIADEPVVNTWAAIYPGLFAARETMPQSVRAQMQYPPQLMHIQFDDIYFVYHMKDPMTFFNMEDMWDDGDEVLGPVGINQSMFQAQTGTSGKSITFSIEPYYWIAETGKILPAAKDAKEEYQFVQSLVFTPEKALNIRAIPTVYQDGEDYGRLVCLTVPKGHFYLGPEQADAAIDQEPEISQQFGWWQRQGTDVVRGHTTTMLINGEVIYVEPIFIRSQQNPVPQMKKVAVVIRGKARMGDNLEEAVRHALEAAQASQKHDGAVRPAHLKQREPTPAEKKGVKTNDD